ncbi:hypothetical protein FOA52_005642 [Chlamydomonas sp. UWO 241]|nr:hypothetical protein FOA52_005642 [Chlamydomonas sp. UWO 241]
MQDTRALLDELMGKERNVALHERSNKRIRYDDPSVCKYDLGGICPHGRFKNTKSDMGPCEYEVHADHIDWPSIKEEYDKQDDREKEKYERRLMSYLEGLIRTMDMKIARSKERADRESAPKTPRPEEQARLDELNARAKAALMRSGELGEAGDVDTAMAASGEADMYKKQHAELFRKVSAPERSLSVCEVCGVFISAMDADESKWGGKVPQPILDHLAGKQFLGWKALRDQHKSLKEKYAGVPMRLEPVRERERSPRRDERERERSARPDDRDSRGGGGSRSSHDRGGGYGDRGGDRGGGDRRDDYSRGSGSRRPDDRDRQYEQDRDRRRY